MISAVQRDAAEDRSMHLNSLCLMFSLTCWTTVKRSRGRCWLYHSGNSGRDTHAALCMSTTRHVNKHTQLIQHGRATQTQTPRWIQKYDFIRKCSKMDTLSFLPLLSLFSWNKIELSPRHWTAVKRLEISKSLLKCVGFVPCGYFSEAGQSPFNSHHLELRVLTTVLLLQQQQDQFSYQIIIHLFQCFNII